MGKMTFYFKSFCLLIFIFHQTYSISDQRACADEECKEILSYAKTLVKYPSGHNHVLSFSKNQDVIVYSKSAGSDRKYWGVEINGRRGYVPKEFLKETKKLSKAKIVVPTEFFEIINGELVPKTNKKIKELKDGADVVINENVVVEDTNLSREEKTETLPSLESSNELPFISGAMAEPLNSPNGDIKVSQPFNIVDGTTIYSDTVVPSSLNDNDQDESSRMEFDLNDDDGLVEEIDDNDYSGSGDEEVSGDIPIEENVLDDHITGSSSDSNESNILDQAKVQPEESEINPPAEREIKLSKTADNDNNSNPVTKELNDYQAYETLNDSSVIENAANSLDLGNSVNIPVLVSESQQHEEVNEQEKSFTKTIDESDFKGGVIPLQESVTSTETQVSKDNIIPQLNAGETIDLSQSKESKIELYDNSIQNTIISENSLPPLDQNTEPSISLNSNSSHANLSLASSLPVSNNESMLLDANSVEKTDSIHDINHNNANNLESTHDRNNIMHDDKLSNISQQKIFDAVPLSQHITNNDIVNSQNDEKETIVHNPVDYDMTIENVYLKPQSSNSSPNLEPISYNHEEETKVTSQNDTQTIETDILNNTNILDTKITDQGQQESLPIIPENITVPTERSIDVETTPVNIYQYEVPIIPTDELSETSTQSFQIIEETVTQLPEISSKDLPTDSSLENLNEQRSEPVKIQHLPYPGSYFPNLATLNVKSKTEDDSINEIKENTLKLNDDQLMPNEERILDVPDKNPSHIPHPGYNIQNINSKTEELVESAQEYKDNASELKDDILAQSEVKILEEVDKNMFINDQVSTEPISAEAQAIGGTYVSNTMKIFESLFEQIVALFKSSNSASYEPDKRLEEEVRSPEFGGPGQSQDFVSSIFSGLSSSCTEI